MEDEQVVAFLVRLGAALSTGDMGEVSACWGYPALVVSDDGAIGVTGPREVEEFFGQAVRWYNEQGLVRTTPDLLHVERLSEQVLAVDVRWTAFDAADVEQSNEVSHYLLRRGPDDGYRIHVAATRTD